MPIEYKVLHGSYGFPAFEKEVSKHLNSGWKTIGGMVFNQGYPYQAVAKMIKAPQKSVPSESTPKPKYKNIAANEYY